MRKIFFQISLVGFCCAGLALTACGQGSQVGTDLDTLGTSSPEIVGGSEVTRQNPIAKSIVALVSELSDGRQALCTATILDSQSILTAAHCVDEKPVKMSVVFSSRVQGVRPEDVREATTFSQNPRWKSSKGQLGDLAVVHFEGGLPSGYQPVTLVAKSGELEKGREVLLAGYGVTNGDSHTGSGVLRQTVSQVMGLKSKTQTITDGRKSSVCFGDSGGPGFIKEGNFYVQWGVANSVMNSSCNEASIHTNVLSYEKWIKSTALRLEKNKSKRKSESDFSQTEDELE